MNKNIRERLNDATAGRPGGKPVYAVYDWFVEHRPHIDWQGLFGLGLGRINHATVIRHDHPNFRTPDLVWFWGGFKMIPI